MIISFIVPIYNAEKYISQCIESILNQSGAELDIVLVNDGSTDRSDQICQEYCKKYSNIQYVSVPNAGVSAARNLGIKQAKGEWICFVDSDDYLLDNCLVSVVPHLTANISVLCCNYVENNQMLPFKRTLSCITPIDAKKYLFDFMGNKEIISTLMTSQHMIFSPCWGKFYRKKLFNNSQISFPLDLKLSEDLYFNYLVFSFAEQIYCFDFPIYSYTCNTQSVTHQINDSYIAKRLVSLAKLLKIEDCNAQTQQCINRYILTQLLTLNYQINWVENPKLYKKILNELLTSQNVVKLIYQDVNHPNTDGTYQKLYYKAICYLWKHKFYKIASLTGRLYGILKKVKPY